MNTCPWKKIEDFRSLSEFDKFVEWMDVQTKSGAAKTEAVGKPYSGATTFHEKWFRHVASGKVWRLVWPDAPFTGIFEPVDDR